MIVALIFFGFVFIWREISASNYSIRSVSVPAAFSDAGYTGQVLANRIFDRLNNIIERERLADVATEYKDANSAVDLNVEVVGIGVPIRSFVAFVSNVLGIHNQKTITMEFALNADTIMLEIRISGDVERHQAALKNNIEASLKKLEEKASESILKHSNPYVLARHYLGRDSKSSYELGRYLLSKYEGNPHVEPIAYFAWAGSFFTEGNSEAGEKKAREGLVKYPHDINLHAALGTFLRMGGKIDEAILEDRKIIAMLTSRTPLNRRTQTFLNLAYDFAAINKYDSTIIYAEKAFRIDKQNRETLILLAEMNFLKADTLSALKYLDGALSNGFPLSDLTAWHIYRMKDDRRFKILFEKY